jgi:membrane dipeptidase
MKSIPIIDGHIDILSRIVRDKIEFDEDNKNANTDLPKLTTGNVKAAFFAICITSLSKYTLDEYKNILNKLINEKRYRLSLIKSHSDLEKTINDDDKIGLILHLEGAYPVKEDFSNLKELYEYGVRSIGIVWSDNSLGMVWSNAFGDGSDNGRGLSEAGKSLVKKCNIMGILIDVSHLNEKGFWDVIEITKKPIIASHSNCYSLCQNSRNLKDEQIIAIAKKGGVIGISVNPVFIKNLNLKPGELIPMVYSDVSIEEMVKHIDYVKSLVGIDHVALGSDFDGGPVPAFLNNASKYQKLVKHLYERGYSNEEIEKICYKNFLRVFKTVLKD